MAQTLQNQDSRESSNSSGNNNTNHNIKQSKSTNKGSIDAQRQSTPTSRFAKTTPKTSGAPQVASQTPLAKLELDNSSVAHSYAAPFNPILLNRHQASKVFLAKCRTELETLLESIKDQYHEEIKSLYNNSPHPDLFFLIGEEELKKPLHRCVFASRAFKLYNTLRAFQLVETPIEEDIIISEFQTQRDERNSISTEELEGNETKEDQSRDEKLIEEWPIYFHLPSELISSDLLLNFVRRIYLDQEIGDEEGQLNRQLIDWLKQNRPELIKVKQSNKNSPDHRESFRTIQPDFDNLAISKDLTMPQEQHQPQQQQNFSMEDIESNTDNTDEASQATSFRDESAPGSLLTRTETFELISKTAPDGSSIKTAFKNVPVDLNTDDDPETDISNAETNSSPSSYAPTTRTGLRPKTFTTPVGLRTTRTTSSSSKQATPISKSKDVVHKKVNASTPPKTSAASSKQSSAGTSPAPIASKRSSIASNHSELEFDTHATKSATMVGKTKIPSNDTIKAKPTLIARAHPISMERSQSPGTTVLRSSGKNFITANKRVISQMEKKSSVPIDQSNQESETENMDESDAFALESLTSNNLVAQMDKFALISYSKLADALSRMFIDSLFPDTTIFAMNGQQINAHRSILSSRSAYLHEVITKQSLPLATSESSAGAGRQLLKIDLTEFSHASVYFSVLHIYSGIVKIPDDLDLNELTKLTNLLHVTTLRQVCIHNLRMNYCHFFHKPCNICCIGVLKTLPLAWRYDYTQLYSKCLQWIGSHFSSIFCLKEFSELKPHDLLEECYSATLSQLTPDNIIPKTIECQQLLKNLPRVKWSESIICLVGRLLEDFCHYVAENYEKILQSESFLNLGKNCWECEILEENLLAAMNHLKPDSGCKTLIQLHKIECSLESSNEDPKNANESFASLVSKMRKYCERYLLKDAAAVVHCSSWRHMKPSLQKRIRDQAILSTDFDEPTKQLASKPKLPSMSRVSQNQANLTHGRSSSSEDARSPSNRSTPESRLKSPSSYLPPPKNKTAAARHVKVLK